MEKKFLRDQPHTLRDLWAWSLGVLHISQRVLSYIITLGPIPGLPGEDYPAYSFPPETSFLCSGQVAGYYADQEADCQSYHICGEEGRLLTTRLCPNGTLYNQQYFICDWWFNVDCSVVSGIFCLAFSCPYFHFLIHPFLDQSVS